MWALNWDQRDLSSSHVWGPLPSGCRALEGGPEGFCRVSGSGRVAGSGVGS